jgi:hypothetical protein
MRCDDAWNSASGSSSRSVALCKTPGPHVLACCELHVRVGMSRRRVHWHTENSGGLSRGKSCHRDYVSASWTRCRIWKLDRETIQASVRSNFLNWKRPQDYVADWLVGTPGHQVFGISARLPPPHLPTLGQLFKSKISDCARNCKRLSWQTAHDTDAYQLVSTRRTWWYLSLPAEIVFLLQTGKCHGSETFLIIFYKYCSV